MNKVLLTYILLLFLSIPLTFHLQTISQTPVSDTDATVELTATQIQTLARLNQTSTRFVLIEFTDFQCPYCAQAQEPISVLQRLYANDLRIVKRHMPLTQIHPLALDMARIYECTPQYQQDQVSKWLFANQDTSLVELKKQSFFDAECFDDPQTAQKIAQDISFSNYLNLTGTPSYILIDMQTLNNNIYIGFPNIALIQRTIEGWIYET